jgi:hypothetical protein
MDAGGDQWEYCSTVKSIVAFCAGSSEQAEQSKCDFPREHVPAAMQEPENCHRDFVKASDSSRRVRLSTLYCLAEGRLLTIDCRDRADAQ